jgi:hypothetical protein
MSSKSVVLVSNVDAGLPGPEHFRVSEEPAPTVAPEGGVIVRCLVLSGECRVPRCAINSGCSFRERRWLARGVWRQPTPTCVA